MAASAAVLDMLSERYQDALIRLTDSSRSLAGGTFGSPGFAAQITPTIRATQEAAATLTSTFYDQYTRLATSSDRVPTADITAIMDTLKVSDYGSAADAMAAAQLADQDVMLASAAAADDGAKRNGITRFRRRPNPGACSFCRKASDQIYRTADLRPLHTKCHCVTVPAVGVTAPERTLTRPELPPLGDGRSALGIPSAGLRIPDDPTGGRVAEAMGVVDRLHRMPATVVRNNPYRLPIDTTAAKGQAGAYRFGVTTGDAKGFAVSSAGDRQGFSMVHEFGHYLDHQGLGGPSMNGTFASRRWAGTPPIYGRGSARVLADDTPDHWRKFFDAWDRSDASRQLAESATDPKIKAYMREPEEVFARAYSQWVSRFDDDLGRQMAAQRTAYPGYQWADDDFATMADAIEAILRAEGLIA